MVDIVCQCGTSLAEVAGSVVAVATVFSLVTNFIQASQRGRLERELARLEGEKESDLKRIAELTAEANGWREVGASIDGRLNELMEASVEARLRARLSAARGRLHDAIAEALDGDCRKARDRRGVMLEVEEEELSNAFEEACAHFLDGKVNRDWFKRIYGGELRKWAEGHPKVADGVSFPNTARTLEALGKGSARGGRRLGPVVSPRPARDTAHRS